jgi:hypothetical protein
MPSAAYIVRTKYFPGSCRMRPLSSSSNKALKISDEERYDARRSTSWSM